MGGVISACVKSELEGVGNSTLELSTKSNGFPQNGTLTFTGNSKNVFTAQATLQGGQEINPTLTNYYGGSSPPIEIVREMFFGALETYKTNGPQLIHEINNHLALKSAMN